MKSLTVKLADEVYEGAERRAAERGETLSREVAEFVKRYADGRGSGLAENGPSEQSGDLGCLFAALDAGRNVESVGAWSRDELYDRPVLH